MSRLLVCVALMLSLIVAATACAPPEAPVWESEEDFPRRFELDEYYLWTPEDEWRNGLQPRTRIAFPSAVNGTPYDRHAWRDRHLVLVLSAEGILPGGLPLDSDEAHRFIQQARATVKRPGTSQPPILVRTPQRTPWHSVRVLIASATGDKDPMPEVRIELAQRFSEARRLDLDAATPLDPLAQPVEIELAAHVRKERHWVRLAAAGNRFEFPVDSDFFGPPMTTEGPPRVFNAVWWKVQGILTEQALDTHGAAIHVVEEEGPVQLAYVVSLLDVLIDVGCRTVAFPEEGWTFGIAPPPPPVPYEPPPALRSWVLLASALGVVVAFAVAIGSVGRSRRRRLGARHVGSRG